MPTHQQLRHRPQLSVQDHTHHLRTAELISQSINLVSSSLASQSESVAYVSEAAEASLENVRAGNRELEEVVKRPSTLRNAAVILLLSLTALLLFLDYYN